MYLMNDVKIGHRIKMARESVGLTQAELAEKIGVEPASVSRWELGQSAPRSHRIKQLSEILNREPDWFVGISNGDDKTQLHALEARIKELEKSSISNELPSAPKELMKLPLDILEALSKPLDRMDLAHLRAALGLRDEEYEKLIGLGQKKKQSDAG